MYTDLERDLQRPTTSPGRSSQHVVTGRWLFSFAVVVESLRIPCGGVFAGLFVLFFEGSCPVSGAVVSCVHDLRLWSTRSQGLQGAVRLSATRFRGRRVRFGASIFVREEKAHRRSVQTSQYPMFPMQSKINSKMTCTRPSLLRRVERRLRFRSSKISCFGRRRPIGIRRVADHPGSAETSSGQRRNPNTNLVQGPADHPGSAETSSGQRRNVARPAVRPAERRIVAGIQSKMVLPSSAPETIRVNRPGHHGTSQRRHPALYITDEPLRVVS